MVFKTFVNAFSNAKRFKSDEKKSRRQEKTITRRQRNFSKQIFRSVLTNWLPSNLCLVSLTYDVDSSPSPSLSLSLLLPLSLSLSLFLHLSLSLSVSHSLSVSLYLFFFLFTLRYSLYYFLLPSFTLSVFSFSLSFFSSLPSIVISAFLLSLCVTHSHCFVLYFSFFSVFDLFIHSLSFFFFPFLCLSFSL